MKKLLIVYGAEMTSLQEMKFMKHINEKGISMNTKSKEERKILVSDWLANHIN